MYMIWFSLVDVKVLHYLVRYFHPDYFSIVAINLSD
jgi:hypothetical protein